MKRTLILIVGLAIAAAVAVSSASASITPSTPTNPPFTSTNYQILSPWACGGNGGTYSISNPRPILMKFGWFAKLQSQIQDFFTYVSGFYSITGTTDSFTDSWSANPAGNAPVFSPSGIAWSPPTATTITPNGKTQVRGYVTWYYAVLTFTSPGTYAITTSMTFNRKVSDGFGFTTAGTYTTGPCTITVTP